MSHKSWCSIGVVIAICNHEFFKTSKRYSTLFTHDRPAVTDTLRKFVDEEEMIRRIIYIATTEGILFNLYISNHWPLKALDHLYLAKPYSEQLLNRNKLFMLPR